MTKKGHYVMASDYINVELSGMLTRFSAVSARRRVQRKNNLGKDSDAKRKLNSVNINITENDENIKIAEEADYKRRFDSFECRNSKEKQYKDNSNDSSYQNHTKTDAEAIADNRFDVGLQNIHSSGSSFNAAV